MNTPTHIIAASAILSRNSAPAQNRAIIAGALIPDVSIYIMSVWALATGRMNEDLWTVTYWQDPWQTLGAITNSVPLAFALLALGLWRNWPVLSALAGALLIHAALDFPVHTHDAHRHFWPLSDWRFHAPLSYWDPNDHGMWGGLLDSAVLLTGCALLWARFQARWLRGLIIVLVGAALAYAAVIVWASLA